MNQHSSDTGNTSDDSERAADVPAFLRQFSKETNGAERSQVASHILETRREFHSMLNQRQKKMDELQAMTAQKNALTERMANQKETAWKKIRYALSNRKLQSDIDALTASLHEEQKQLERIASDIRQLTGADDAPEDAALRSTSHAILQDFYRHERSRWERSPYTKEEISTLFSPEHLAALSLEEYEMLLSHFPSHLVTHVSRQGLRDHTGMIYHSAGAGNFSDGFKSMLKDGKLHSPLNAILKDTLTQEGVIRLLRLSKEEGKEKALRVLEEMTSENQGLAGYADKSAIHVACNEVADALYGAETYNEVFVVFPSALVASHYTFGGNNLVDAGGGNWNDVWIWDRQEGMDLNAGVVFLPAQTLVDPHTGSRYERLGDKGVVDEAFVQSVENMMRSDAYRAKVEALHQQREQLRADRLNHIAEEVEERKLFSKFVDQLKAMNVHGEKMLKILTSEHAIQAALGSTFDTAKALQKHGCYYKTVQNGIPAKDYWEDYFKKHPQERPSKIIYYTEKTPTAALNNWKAKWQNRTADAQLRQAGQHAAASIEFPENTRLPGSAESLRGVEEFKDFALGVIDDFFEDVPVESGVILPGG